MKIFLGSLVLVALLGGCSDVANEAANVGSTSICKPIDYRNGVMYFPCAEANFGNSLSTWLLMNSAGVEILAITSDNTGIRGSTIGYFVFVKQN